MSNFDYADKMNLLKETRENEANSQNLVSSSLREVEGIAIVDVPVWNEENQDGAMKLVRSGALRYTTGKLFIDQHRSE